MLSSLTLLSVTSEILERVVLPSVNYFRTIQIPTMPKMNVSDNLTLTYTYGAGDKEFVFCCKNRPFAVLCSSSLPTPAASLIDHNLVMELGLKITDLQCKKISFAGRKLRLLGKISTTVQCIKDGKLFANIHLCVQVLWKTSRMS